MTRYVLSKLTGSIITVLSATLVAFILLRVLPGDPAQLVVGRLATPQELANTRRAMGLDLPLPIQFVDYIWDFVRGNWGYSYSVGKPVTTLIATRLPASLELGFYAFLLAFGAALALSLLSIRHPLVDHSVRGLAFLGLGTPPFWLALLLLLVFSEHFHLFPGPEGRLSPNVAPPPPVTHFYTIDALIAGQFGTFWNAAWHLVLPALALGFADFAFMFRLLRTNLMEVSREPFIAVVRSKGLQRAEALRRHALPNAFLPTLTVSGLVLAELLAGSVLVETVFDWPGVGQLVEQSITRADYSVVEIFILLSAIAYVLVNLTIDILYGVIDPRVRLQSAVAK